MAFFEELGRKAKDVAAVAADKAKDMAAVAADKARETTEKTKISVAIAGEQREIEKNCRLIGEWFINEYEGELPEGVQELADAVAASKARIAELEEQKNAKVAAWRKKESYKRTMTRRPDLFANFDETKLTTKAERKILAQAKEEFAAEQAETSTEPEE